MFHITGSQSAFFLFFCFLFSVAENLDPGVRLVAGYTACSDINSGGSKEIHNLILLIKSEEAANATTSQLGKWGWLQCNRLPITRKEARSYITQQYIWLPRWTRKGWERMSRWCSDVYVSYNLGGIENSRWPWKISSSSQAPSVIAVELAPQTPSWDEANCFMTSLP